MIYRIWRSPYSRFAGLNSVHPDDSMDETIHAVNVYTDSVLREIADNGFNAIWVHAVPANFVRSPDFPEFGTNAEKHFAAMNRLISNAARFGIKVFLYMQPVRSVAEENTAFWRNHASCAGQKEMSVEQIDSARMDREIVMVSLCTSAPEVKNLVRDTGRTLAEAMPELGGVLLITASEYPGHCYSHRVRRNPGPWSPLIECPRCSAREPREIAAELVTLIHDGIREKSDTVEVIAWNWGWSMWDSSPEPLMKLLPRDVILMADFERGGKMDLAERPGFSIDEYSLVYDGPSPRCLSVFDASRKMGFRFMTKLQIGATHELSDVPGIPLMNSIYRKASWLRNHPETGYMGCWNFGNLFSSNSLGFNLFLRKETPSDQDSALRRFAETAFPGCDSSALLRAWNLFEKASKYYPFRIPFLYRGAHTCSLGYAEIFRPEPLRGEPFGCSYFPKAVRGDDLSGSIPGAEAGFSLDELIGNLGKMSVLWNAGAEEFREGMRNAEASPETGNAIVCGCVWLSTENIYRAYRLRKNWTGDSMPEFLRIVRAEIDAVSRALPYVDSDERFGWHGEAFTRLFSPETMRKKLDFLRKILQESGTVPVRI